MIERLRGINLERSWSKRASAGLTALLSRREIRHAAHGARPKNISPEEVGNPDPDPGFDPEIRYALFLYMHLIWTSN
jgi:hypothetical protein